MKAKKMTEAEKEHRRLKKELARRMFLCFCKQHGLPEPISEYKFHPSRKWKFDWLFDGWLALEIQGGNWVGGRHVQPGALIDEYEKINHAVLEGYSIMFCTTDQVEKGLIFPLLKKALSNGEND